MTPLPGVRVRARDDAAVTLWPCEATLALAAGKGGARVGVGVEDRVKVVLRWRRNHRALRTLRTSAASHSRGHVWLGLGLGSWLWLGLGLGLGLDSRGRAAPSSLPCSLHREHAPRGRASTRLGAARRAACRRPSGGAPPRLLRHEGAEGAQLRPVRLGHIRLGQQTVGRVPPADACVCACARAQCSMSQLSCMSAASCDANSDASDHGLSAHLSRTAALKVRGTNRPHQHQHRRQPAARRLGLGLV
eukprot:scaffold56777_cov64-Phaeocystis_antarctica.AAC.12